MGLSLNIGSAFAATTTLSVPLGTGENWLPLELYIPKSVLFANAWKSALKGVSAFGSGLVPIGASPTTVTPHGWPPATTARGILRVTRLFWSGSGSGVGPSPSTCHPEPMSAPNNRDANQYPSEESGKYQITAGAFGFPSSSFLNTSKLISRGPANF